MFYSELLSFSHVLYAALLEKGSVFVGVRDRGNGMRRQSCVYVLWVGEVVVFSFVYNFSTFTTNFHNQLPLFILSQQNL